MNSNFPLFFMRRREFLNGLRSYTLCDLDTSCNPYVSTYRHRLFRNSGTTIRTIRQQKRSKCAHLAARDREGPSGILAHLFGSRQ